MFSDVIFSVQEKKKCRLSEIESKKIRHGNQIPKLPANLNTWARSLYRYGNELKGATPEKKQ